MIILPNLLYGVVQYPPAMAFVDAFLISSVAVVDFMCIQENLDLREAAMNYV